MNKTSEMVEVTKGILGKGCRKATDQDIPLLVKSSIYNYNSIYKIEKGYKNAVLEVHGKPNILQGMEAAVITNGEDFFLAIGCESRKKTMIRLLKHPKFCFHEKHMPFSLEKDRIMRAKMDLGYCYLFPFK